MNSNKGKVGESSYWAELLGLFHWAELLYQCKLALTVCPATPCDETPRSAKPHHLLHANHPNPRYYVLPTEWSSVISTDLRRKTAIIFPFSVYFLANCVLILCACYTQTDLIFSDRAS